MFPLPTAWGPWLACGWIFFAALTLDLPLPWQTRLSLAPAYRPQTGVIQLQESLAPYAGVKELQLQFNLNLSKPQAATLLQLDQSLLGVNRQGDLYFICNLANEKRKKHELAQHLVPGQSYVLRLQLSGSELRYLQDGWRSISCKRPLPVQPARISLGGNLAGKNRLQGKLTDIQASLVRELRFPLPPYWGLGGLGLCTVGLLGWLVGQARQQPLRVASRHEFWWLTALSLAWAGSTWLNSFDDFTLQESSLFAGYVGLALGLELLLYLPFALRASSSRAAAWAAAGWLALWGVLNLTTLSLGYLEGFQGLALGSKAGVLALVGLGLGGILFWVAAQAKPPWLLYGLVLLLLLQSGGSFLLQRNATKGTAGLPMQLPPFSRKPNVYLVGFDALVPPALAKKFFHIDSLQYAQVVEQEGLRLLRNSFGAVNTTTALQALISMQDGATAALPPDFATQADSPLYAAFKQQGYQVQLVVRSPFFGGQGSSTLDRLILAQPLAGVCEHNDQPLGLLGYCLPWVQRLVGQHLFPMRPWPEALFARIKETAATGQPWLTVSYLFTPGHVWLSYDMNQAGDFAAYRQHFETEADGAAAAVLRSLIQTIKQHDPAAILVVFGDHGSHFTWGSGISHRDLAGNLPSQPSPAMLQAVQDHRGVLLAIHPAGLCPEAFSPEPFVLAQVGRSLLQCLSGQEPWPQQPLQTDYLRPYRYE